MQPPGAAPARAVCGLAFLSAATSASSFSFLARTSGAWASRSALRLRRLLVASEGSDQKKLEVPTCVAEGGGERRGQSVAAGGRRRRTLWWGGNEIRAGRGAARSEGLARSLCSQ